MVDFPYNAAHPVVYDNDAHADVYTDELLLALSSAGKIRLKGVHNVQSRERVCQPEYL